jgi:hypothetical protein
VSIHTSVAPVKPDRSRQPVADSLVEGPAYSRRKRYQGFLTAFAVDEQDAVTMLVAEVINVAPLASEMRSPSRPSIATRAKSNLFDDSRAAARTASNCR